MRPRIEFGEFRAGAAGDGSLDVRNVPYFVPHRSASKRWQGYFLCTKDGLKERDWHFTRSFEETFPDKSAPIVVGCKTGGDVSQVWTPEPDPRLGPALEGCPCHEHCIDNCGKSHFDVSAVSEYSDVT